MSNSKCRRGHWALLALAVPAVFGQTVTLHSPRDYQVFQRQSKTLGTIRIAGNANVPCDRAEVALSGDSPFGKLPAGWQPATLDPQSGAFHAELELAAGGWYTVELRLLRDDAAVAHAEVPHVGVGEVFIVAGQSNATNYGEVRQQIRSGMVAAYSASGWTLANDPQPGVQDSSKNGSFIPAFGDDLYERYRVPIGIAAVGHGSTSVRQWLPKGDRFEIPPTMGKFVHNVAPGVWESDGTLFDGMMNTVHALGRRGFRALLWHQGESDAHQQPAHDIPASEYARMLERIIRVSRERAGLDYPWFVAQASYHTPDDPSCPPIRDAQRSLWQSGLALEGPDTDQLTGDNRQNGGRGVHFSAKGLEAHGRLWAAKVSAWLDSVLF
jgi:hypothetical protein